MSTKVKNSSKSKKSEKTEKLIKPAKTKKTKKTLEESGIIENDISTASGGADIVEEKQLKMNKDNIPTVVRISEINESIFDHEPNVIFSSNIDYPRSEYGFHHFIHNNKQKTEKLNVFEGKKKVYLVFNRFEKTIDNYDKSIDIMSKQFFESIGPEIMSREFYKLWEILLLFDLIDHTQDKFVSAHIADVSGSFIQASIFYRDTYSKKMSKSDKYYSVNLYPEDVGKENIKQINEDFNKFYSKEKNQRLIINNTYPKKQTGGTKSKDKIGGAQISEKADLVTANGRLNWINENIQEQEAFRLIIAEVIGGIKLQKKNGNFVCKFFETFTKTSLKIISMLRDLYTEVYFIKPLTSRLASSEKYVVCKGFKYGEKDSKIKEIIKKLDQIQTLIHNNKNDKIVDIFPNFVLSSKFIREMIEVNKEISNNQLKSIGEIISFVDKEIYSGDEYHERREKQIEGTEFWNSVFLCDPSNLTKNKKQRDLLINSGLEISTKGIEKLNKLMVHVENQN